MGHGGDRQRPAAALPQPPLLYMAQAPDLSKRPDNLHARLTTPGDEEADPLVQQTGCVKAYTALEVRCCCVG